MFYTVQEDQVEPCLRCPYAEHFDPVLPDPRKIDPTEVLLYIVGEAPGRDENKAEGDERKPFIGMAGKLLRRAIKEVIPSEDGIRIWNAVNCMTADEHGKPRNPTSKEAYVCSAFVKHDILMKQPHAILLLGKVAANAFFPDIDATMSGMRTQTWEWATIPTRITYHPSYIQRQGGYQKGHYLDWVQDIQEAWDIALPF